jgi:hypothetical protein
MFASPLFILVVVFCHFNKFRLQDIIHSSKKSGHALC